MITVYTVAFNGYGKFLKTWVKNVQAQTNEAKMFITLGSNHGADTNYLDKQKIPYTYVDTTNMGKLRNIAIDEIDTPWMLYFSADDILLPNAVEEIVSLSEENDCIPLKYLDMMLNNTIVERTSAFLTRDDMHLWAKTKVPGYLAVRKIINDKIMYYREIDVPNYPYLFDLANENLRVGVTQNVCAKYARRKGSMGHTAIEKNLGVGYREVINDCLREYIDIKESIPEIFAKKSYRDKRINFIIPAKSCINHYYKRHSVILTQNRIKHLMNKGIAVCR